MLNRWIKPNEDLQKVLDKAIAEELRALAVETETVLWTAAQVERLLPELALEHLLLLLVKAAGVEVMPVRSIGPGTAGIVQRLLIERPFNDILRPEFRHPQAHCITSSH